MSRLLLHMDARDRAALRWMRTWAGKRLTACKRSRKYRPAGTPIGSRETAVLRALLDLRNGAMALLGEGDDAERGPPNEGYA